MFESRSFVVATGGAGGIREACCRYFTDRCWHMAIADTNAVAAERIAKKIGDSWRHLDVGNSKKIQQVARETEKSVGPVETLVNSAGTIQRPVPPDEPAFCGYDRIVRNRPTRNVPCFGCMRSAREAT